VLIDQTLTASVSTRRRLFPSRAYC
jgi:hypothetical protein